MSEATIRREPGASRSTTQQPAPATAHPTHWARPDIAGDVLAVARAPGAAPPRGIRIRPELHARLLAQPETAGGPSRTPEELAGIPLVVDPTLPVVPGFEVVRARPGADARPHVAAA